jgi:hypothetical protein
MFAIILRMGFKGRKRRGTGPHGPWTARANSTTPSYAHQSLATEHRRLGPRCRPGSRPLRGQRIGNILDSISAFSELVAGQVALDPVAVQVADKDVADGEITENNGHDRQ